LKRQQASELLLEEIKIKVDSAFLEWDNVRMSKQLQQLDPATKSADHMAVLNVRTAALNANSALLLGLVLSIIPTISGVALIA